MRLRVYFISRLVWSSRHGWWSEFEIGLDLGAWNCEQRADDWNVVHHERGMNPHQTACAGATQELHQDRFYLVVCTVSGGDGIEALLLSQLDQPLVPQLAGGVLEAEFVRRSVLADVCAAGEK